ncbi:hypothetical protein GBO93_07265 [Pediococcus acidilactici]|uniref:hypothetical protein n=1 Tax=Pediococcus acidilactici TaxID=1254 RepID=UPI001328E74B|nr:hypothetical protein [Pediococcus acidilactici]KAF0343798.1 hypothetical protein GBO43_08315 [Pediococcus acidilactici]KAF0353617.1 hypothetical protein GBO47_08370 [Pediococcus acidilactici]KAF0357953.1 hypothetical protein GBO51_08350 [Pediococcus acidilactici]KAF0362115.1 hypothetical protein GBO53_08300 [Pediococcus acidilactici]KAF0408640.1 hypothetical protein GBO74_08565 [Pediococcus acidilactici]
MTINSELDMLIHTFNYFSDVVNRYFDTELEHTVKTDITATTFNSNYRNQLLNRYYSVTEDVNRFVQTLEGLNFNRTIDGISLNRPALIEMEGLTFNYVQNYITKQEEEINQTLTLAKQILTEQGLIDEEGDNDD